MAFQQGLSGLNAASKNLDVIGHNVANANTTGFKASRAEFAEAVASAIGSASGQTSGIGVNVAAVTQQFRQGPITNTGNSLDVAINGNGFFVVRQTDGSTAYTRAGNFGLDKEGNLKTVQGDNVMGYPVDAATGTVLAGSQPVPMSLPSGQPIPAKSTSKIEVSLNLDARATPAAGDATATPPVAATPRATYGTSLNVYDSQGVATPVQLYFEKGTAPNTWNVFRQLDDPTAAPPVVATSIATLTFDGNGKFVSAAPNTPIQIPSNNPNAPTPGTINGTTGVTLDFSQVTQQGSKFAVDSVKQDGYTTGTRTGVSIGNDGSIVATYSNGVKRTEGQLALAAFTNTQGLASIGDNKWAETSESGPAVNGSAETGTFGSLRSGALEESNVDLTAELVNMMTAQRFYQANAQTIKTQDQVFSTLVNLR